MAASNYVGIVPDMFATPQGATELNAILGADEQASIRLYPHNFYSTRTVERPQERNTDEEDMRTRILAEARELALIRAETVRCTEACDHEAEWNNAVHGRILRTVFGPGVDGANGVGYRYMYVGCLSSVLRQRCIHAKQ